MSWASTCPAAIAGLLAALRRTAALSGVLITNAAGITDLDAREVISVGFDPAGGPAAQAQVTREGAGGPDRERYPIRCAIGVTSGDEGEAAIAAAQERVFELLGAVAGAVKADPQLGGAVMSAWVSSWSLAQAQFKGGVTATLRAEVTVDAYTQR